VAGKRLKNPKSAQVIDTLAEKYKLNRAVVKEIVNSPWKFFKHVSADIGDMRPVRFMYFGAFVQRPVKNKYHFMERQYKRLIEFLPEAYVVMRSVLGFPVTSEESAKRVLDAALETKDVWKIEMIYKEWKVYHDGKIHPKKKSK